MKKIILSVAVSAIALYPKAQIITSSTSPSTIAAQVPGYSQVSTINTKSYSYTPSVPSTSPMPVDEPVFRNTTPEKFNYSKKESLK